MVQLKREEIIVEHRYFLWQKAHNKPLQARELDPEQTLMEQAYAAAMSARWRLIHRMHRRLKNKSRKSLKWIVIGFEMQPEGELHLQRLVRANIARIERNMRTGP